MKRIDERKAPVVILWFAVLVIGAIVVSVGYIDFKKEIRDVEALFEAHVESVVLLINEGTREATASTSLVYEISEKHLLTVAELVRDAARCNPRVWPHLRAAHHMSVWVSSDENGQYDGEWGPVPISARAAVIAWMQDADADFLVDDGPLRRFALACVRLSADEETGDIVCRDANELKRHRRYIGIGPLLKGVTQKDIRYVALQDEDGILAVAPSAKLISSFADDPFLGRALRRAEGADRAFRTRTVGDDIIFEGGVPFKMADESVVLLRIGIDGAMLSEVKKNATSRFAITIAWTVGGILLATLLFVYLKRWQRKQIELKKRIKKEADARRHWEDIGRMAATVAHEVRNPLNTIQMVSQRLRSEFAISGDERESFDEMVALMISEGHRVERVVTDFLALGKPLKLERAAYDLETILEESVFALSMRAEKENKQLRLEKVIPAKIFVDAKWFRQMFANLLDNALDAVGDGGTVTVETAVKDREVEIDIVDNGKGLGPDELATVFEPFVSYKSNGNGLGLALVKRLAEAHDGSISLARNTGSGLTAKLTLPIGRKDD